MSIPSVVWQAVGAVWFRKSLGDHPWTFIDVRAAYANGGAAMVVVLVCGGLTAIGWTMSRIARRPQVLDIARTDDPLPAVVVA